MTRTAHLARFFAALGLLAALAVHAADAQVADNKAMNPTIDWAYPVIANFGGVHPRPDAAAQLDPKADYKIFVDVVSTGGDKGKPYNALVRLARLVNLMGYAKVPPSHVHVVALLDRAAGAAALTAHASRTQLKKDNANLAIVHALHKAGVTLLVCSQAMAERGIPDSGIDPAVSITLSGLTDPVIYQQRGYAFMQL